MTQWKTIKVFAKIHNKGNSNKDNQEKEALRVCRQNKKKKKTKKMKIFIIHKILLLIKEALKTPQIQKGVVEPLKEQKQAKWLSTGSWIYHIACP